METEVEESSSNDRPSNVQADMNRVVDQDLRTWLDQLATGHVIKISLRRMEPKKAPDGTNLVGKLADYDEIITEDDIKEQFGGGKFQIIVEKKNAKGNWQYFRTTNVQIPGAPRLDGMAGSATMPRADAPSTVDRALSMAERMAAEERQERRTAEKRAGERTGFDVEAFQALQQPVLEELRAARVEKAALEARVERMLTQKPDNSFQERILTEMTGGAQAQFTTMRANHDAELRQLRQSHNDDIKRIEDRHEKQLDRIEDGHKRELQSIERAADQRLEGVKQAYEGRIDGFKADIARLERDLSGKETELARLRAIKEKGPLDAIQEAVALKESMAELGLVKSGDDDDEEEDGKMPGWVKGLNVLLDNPMAAGIAERIAGGPPNQAAQQAAAHQASQKAQFEAWAAQLPVGRPVDIGDGRLFVKLPDGRVVPWNQERMRRAKAAATAKRQGQAPAAGAAPAEPGAVPAPVVSPGPPLRVDREDLGKAVRFIESAIRAGTSPEQFAASAVSLAPKPVMLALKKQTVEWFLEHAEIDDGSPINTQAGRDWLRALMVVLKGVTV